MANFCIFCGEKPESKTKEHVLPQWLLNMTGNPKRTIKLGLPFNNQPENSIREISFDSLHFPACHSCNDEYARLEGSVKPIVEAMFNSAAVSVNQISLFLDWLDKVRIGLWLGFIYLENNYFGIDPNFYIKNRVGKKDRMIIVARANDNRCGIHFIGVNVPLFHHSPTCFSLALNNLYFINISADFLLARRMGLPYPQKSVFQTDGRILIDLMPARKRIMKPVLNIGHERFGKEIMQPIFDHGISLYKHPFYNNDYVKDISLDYEKGIGFPFVANGKNLNKYSIEPSMDWYPSEAQERYSLHNVVIEQTLGIQAKLWDYLYTTEDKLMKTKMRSWKEYNKKLLSMGSNKISTLA